MAFPKCPDEEFIDLFQKIGPLELARRLGIGVRNVFNRRRRIEKSHDICLSVPGKLIKESSSEYPTRRKIELKNGTIIVFGDSHYWPGEISTAHRALVLMCKELKPKIIVANGDCFDGARIGKHPEIGFESKKPTVKQELEAVMDRLTEIRKSSPDSSLYWNVGNHDMRFNSAIANRLKEFDEVPGSSIKDHFPGWKFQISLWVNNSVVIKHRFRGGIHATHNNALHGGKTMVTNHLHSLKWTPFSDYSGTRYGVDCGTLSDPCGKEVASPQFDYNEDNPQNQRSGFVVLTFSDGDLLIPEIAQVYDEEHIQFRGKIISVEP